MIAIAFDVFDGAGAVFLHRVHVELALAIGLQRIVMAVNEYGGSWEQAWVHAHAFTAIEFDEHKTLPVLTAALRLGAEMA